MWSVCNVFFSIAGNYTILDNNNVMHGWPDKATFAYRYFKCIRNQKKPISGIMKKYILLALMTIVLAGQTALAQDKMQTKKEERIEKRADRANRRMNESKARLERKNDKVDKKERKMHKKQRRANAEQRGIDKQSGAKK